MSYSRVNKLNKLTIVVIFSETAVFFLQLFLFLFLVLRGALCL